MKAERDISKLPKWARELINAHLETIAEWKLNFEMVSETNDELRAMLDRKKSLERIADLDRRVLSQVNKNIDKALGDGLTGFNGPLTQIVERVIGAHDADIYKLVNDEFVTLLTADGFRATLKDALNAKLARVLIARMGGELEKQVNELKRNPQTNALITLAITGVVAKLMEGEQ